MGTMIIDNDFLNDVIKGYVDTIGKITVDERKELRIWVADGNAVCDNPWLLYDERGFMMDFISAYRFNEDMTNNLDAYLTETKNYLCVDDNLPF